MLKREDRVVTMIDLGLHPKVARLALVIGQPINRDVLADLQVRVIGDSPFFEVSQVDVFRFRRRDLGNFTFFEADKRHRSRSWPVYCGTCWYRDFLLRKDIFPFRDTKTIAHRWHFRRALETDSV